VAPLLPLRSSAMAASIHASSSIVTRPSWLFFVLRMGRQVIGCVAREGKSS
jgi:hypothetical protein